MRPATYNFSLVRGSTDPFVFALRARVGDALENIPFTDVSMTIGRTGPPLGVPPLELSISNGRLVVSDPLTAQVTWTPTEAESRSLPHGPGSVYEVEVINGASKIVYLVGTITGLGGLNVDS